MLLIKTITDSAWRLEGIDGDPKASSYVLTRMAENIHAQSIDTIFTAANSKVTITSPKADGQTYAGVFANLPSVKRQMEQSYILTEKLTRVRTVTGDTSLVGPIIGREKELIHPFGEGTGTGWGIVFKYINLLSTSDTKCMAIADTTLEKRMSSDKTYNLIDRKTQVEEDRTLSFYLLAQKKIRTAWTGKGSFQRRATENQGRKPEVRRKFWYGIQASDHDKVMACLQSDTGVDTGYIRMGQVQFNDDDIGAKDYVLTMGKSWTDTRNDSNWENPHAKQHLATVVKRTVMQNYKTSAEPADPSISSGFKFVQVKRELDPSTGLLNKEHIQAKPTASNTVTAGSPTYQDTHVNLSPPVGTARVDSVFKERVDLYDRIPVQQGPAVVQKMGVSDTWYVTTDIGFSDNGDGSGKVERKREKVNKNANWMFLSTDYNLPDKQGIGSRVRVWPKVWDTKARALTDTSTGLANKSFRFASDSYLPGGWSVEPHWDGTSTVRQTGKKYDTNTGNSVDPDWRNVTKYYSYKTPRFRRIRESGVMVDQVRFTVYTVGVMQTTSYNKATSYAANFATYSTKHNVRQPRIEYLEKGRYRVTCIGASITSWGTDAGAYSDLGA